MLERQFEVRNPGEKHFGIDQLERLDNGSSWGNGLGVHPATFEYFQAKVENKLKMARTKLLDIMDFLACDKRPRKDFRFDLVKEKDVQALLEMQLEIKFVLDRKRLELMELLRSI